MRKIQLKEAKANLSAVVHQATRGKPSVITRHAKAEAVVVGIADWERLSRRHDLTLLSRNARHFASMDITVTDPFKKLAPSR
jgi:prevent-host-death family protein